MEAEWTIISISVGERKGQMSEAKVHGALMQARDEKPGEVLHHFEVKPDGREDAVVSFVKGVGPVVFGDLSRANQN